MIFFLQMMVTNVELESKFKTFSQDYKTLSQDYEDKKTWH